MKNAMIIVNYNDYKTTIRLLDNIRDYKCINEIVVVDNNSSDSSYKHLKDYKLNNLTIIKSDENKGYSSALNIGAKYLIEKYKELNLIISNSDIIIDGENDLKELIKTLSNTNVVVAPNIIQDNTLSRGWHIPTTRDDIFLNIVKYHETYYNKHMLYKDDYYLKDISKVEAVSGCFFLITSKHLEEINYFDENVFLYYEENILGFKTRKLKKNIVINNNIDVVHDHAKSIDKSINRINKYKILKRSQYYFEKEYNKANKIQLFILKSTAWLSKVILSIVYKLDRR